MVRSDTPMRMVTCRVLSLLLGCERPQHSQAIHPNLWLGH